MPESAWSHKRERQYEHIKEGLIERGTDERRADEIAARTVNKERARSSQAEEQRGIKGRSRMHKAQLERVLSR